MRNRILLKSRRALRERLEAWDRLSELSCQLLLMVEGYSNGGIAPAEAEKASRRMSNEINRIENLVTCWKMQREGRN